MAIAILAERQSLATKYGTDAPYGALFSTAPLTTGAATGELTGGSPAYARKALSWGAVDGNAKITGAATVFDVAAGTTVVAFGVAASATAGRHAGSAGNGGSGAGRSLSARCSGRSPGCPRAAEPHARRR